MGTHVPIHTQGESFLNIRISFLSKSLHLQKLVTGMAIKVAIIQRPILDNEFHRSVPVTKKETKIEWTFVISNLQGSSEKVRDNGVGFKLHALFSVRRNAVLQLTMSCAIKKCN